MAYLISFKLITYGLLKDTAILAATLAVVNFSIPVLVRAQTPQEVVRGGRVFASCMGCDSQIYLYKDKWYEIEAEGGYVSPSSRSSDRPRVHSLTSVQRVSANVASFAGKYFCSWSSYGGPRRQVTCTRNGWKTLAANAPSPDTSLGPDPTKGMNYRTAMLDISAREAFALFRLNGDLRYYRMGSCLEDQKRTKRDFYSAVALCRNYSGVSN